MSDDSSKLNKMIDDWNKYLDRLKQEEEQSLAMIYDYDIEPLPNDLVDIKTVSYTHLTLPTKA